MVAQIDKKYIKTRLAKLYSRLISYILFEGRPLTTKGRWINPILFGLFKLYKLFPIFRTVKEPCFILGTGRSGTTILGIVLSMHKDLGFLNEPKALWHSIYSYEDLIGSYTDNNADYKIDKSKVTIKEVTTANKLFSMFLLLSFSKRIVDKYPELIFRIEFVKELFPDAKFIFLVRNGWDTCRSIEQWSERLGISTKGDIHNWWGKNNRKWRLLVEQVVPEHPDLKSYQSDMIGWSNHIDMAAVEWIVTMREGMKACERYGDDILRVNFEELCKGPEEKLKEISNYLNLDEDSTYLNYGSEVLKALVPKEPLKLNSSILPAFHKTMLDLGYIDSIHKPN